MDLPALFLGSVSFSFLAAFLSFSAYQRANGNQEALQVYLACVEHKNTGLVQNTQAECVGRLVAYTINVLSAVLGGGCAAGTAGTSLTRHFEVKGVNLLGEVGLKEKLMLLGSFAIVISFVALYGRSGATKVTGAWVAVAARLLR